MGMMDWKKYFKKEKKSQGRRRSNSNSTFPRRGVDNKQKKRSK
jgi:hypothetical protein